VIFPLYPHSVDIAARTIWGEARGCGKAGMSHVMNVIVNRAQNPRWWGSDIVSVCQHPFQFSCWNVSDPNHDKLLVVSDTDPEFAIALDLAAKGIAGSLPDFTLNADSYFALSEPSPPDWAATAVHTISDGWHAFYRTI